MDSQENITAEVREGNPPKSSQNDDSTLPTEMPKPTSGEHAPNGGAESDKKAKKEKHAKKKHAKSKGKKSKKQRPTRDGSDDSSSDDTGDSSSDSDSDHADTEPASADQDAKKRVGKKTQTAQKAKKIIRPKSHKKAVKAQKIAISDSDSYSDSNSDSGSDSDSDTTDIDELDASDASRKNSRRRRRRKQQPQQQPDITNQLQLMQLQQQVQQQQLQLQQLQQARSPYPYATTNHIPPPSLPPPSIPPPYDPGQPPVRSHPGRPRGGHHGHGRNLGQGGLDTGLVVDGKQNQQEDRRRQKATKLDYKRVDQVWDNKIHNFKLQDTTEHTVDAQYEEFVFNVRRSFDWEGRYKSTYVDIKSKLLRECLQDVMGNIKGVSLVDETPKLDPNLLFLYLEDLRKHLKELKKAHLPPGDKHERKKEKKRIETKRQQLKVLLKYLDKDYADVKNTLYPMLENGLISFDLLWALWKPNTLAYTTTYGSQDQPRVFKVEMAEKHCTLMRGEIYSIEGKYFEFDGKQFGYGNISAELGEFRGARKITSLSCYPLQYHKNQTKLRTELIERGKKFVSLSGVNYKTHQGMAYHKKKKAVIKVNINGRIMIDAQVHRRINPNYPISLVRPKDHDILSDDDDDDSDNSDGCLNSLDVDSDGASQGRGLAKIKYVTKAIPGPKGKVNLIRIPKVDGDESNKEKLGLVHGKDEVAEHDGTDDESQEEDDKELPEFTDEEYLIASPVVLGFAFAEKLWLEFTVSGVKEIQWNDNAYPSLVLEPKAKAIVKALVESHKYHAAESIDDVIVGKGKGLVAVLHGPPGTGKTLTAEGISELLKCPLYMVSAGELGTDPRFLESELQKILDICHAWGAILLLDEADVFLEKRNMRDTHRNALVSIFLRQLEYFQGILFLTTNRVETFDDAFQSRIHIALRYDSLDHRAKKAIFKIFIERVRVLEKTDTMPFTEEDYTALARHDLNGRQIKNTVRTAQALAVNKGEPLSMAHISQVLEVHMSFDRDLKGGTGYQDAMRSYF